MVLDYIIAPNHSPFLILMSFVAIPLEAENIPCPSNVGLSQQFALVNVSDIIPVSTLVLKSYCVFLLIPLAFCVYHEKKMIQVAFWSKKR